MAKQQSEALVTQDILQGQVGTLALQRDPDVVLEEAARAAKALKQVLDSKKKKVMMGGERYLEFDDWQTCGRFYGYTVGLEGEPEFVDLGAAQGFKSTAVVMNRDGQVVSRATAFCMNDEDKWSSRPKYVWAYVCKDGTLSEEGPGVENIVWVDNPNKQGKRMPKKEKTQMGEEKVPVFQLASMSQTRACAKAFRNVLSWVVVLAGYKPTPAEELTNAQEFDEDGGGYGDDPPPNHQPQANRAAPRGQQAREIQLVSDAERDEIFKLGLQVGFQSKFATLKFLNDNFQIRDVAEITSKQYPQVMDALRAHGKSPSTQEAGPTQEPLPATPAPAARPAASTNEQPNARPSQAARGNGKDLKIDDNEKNMVWTLARKLAWVVGSGTAEDPLHSLLRDNYRIASVIDLRKSQLRELVEVLQKGPKAYGYSPVAK